MVHQAILEKTVADEAGRCEPKPTGSLAAGTSRSCRRALGRAAEIGPVLQGRGMEWRPGTAALPGLGAHDAFEITNDLAGTIQLGGK